MKTLQARRTENHPGQTETSRAVAQRRLRQSTRIDWPQRKPSVMIRSMNLRRRWHVPNREAIVRNKARETRTQIHETETCAESRFVAKAPPFVMPARDFLPVKEQTTAKRQKKRLRPHNTKSIKLASVDRAAVAVHVRLIGTRTSSRNLLNLSMLNKAICQHTHLVTPLPRAQEAVPTVAPMATVVRTQATRSQSGLVSDFTLQPVDTLQSIFSIMVTTIVSSRTALISIVIGVATAIAIVPCKAPATTCPQYKSVALAAKMATSSMVLKA